MKDKRGKPAGHPPEHAEIRGEGSRIAVVSSGRRPEIGEGVLLVTASAQASRCMRLLERELHRPVRSAPDLDRASAMLREEGYGLVIFDELVLEGSGRRRSKLLAELGTAVPIFLNFAITGGERLASEARAALHRRERELSEASQAVMTELRGELSESLTGILLSSELALSEPGLTPTVEARLRTVYQIASELRSRLEGAA